MGNQTKVRSGSVRLCRKDALSRRAPIPILKPKDSSIQPTTAPLNPTDSKANRLKEDARPGSAIDNDGHHRPQDDARAKAHALEDMHTANLESMKDPVRHVHCFVRT